MGLFFIAFYIVFFIACFAIARIGFSWKLVPLVRSSFVFLLLICIPYYVYLFQMNKYYRVCEDNKPILPNDKIEVPENIYYNSILDSETISELKEIGFEKIFYADKKVNSDSDIGELDHYKILYLNEDSISDANNGVFEYSILRNKYRVENVIVTKYIVFKLGGNDFVSQLGRVIFDWDSGFMSVLFPFEFNSCESVLGFSEGDFSMYFLLKNTFKYKKEELDVE